LKFRLFQNLLLLEKRRQLALGVVGEEDEKKDVKRKCTLM